MTPRQRWTIIGGLLLCTLAALWLAPPDGAESPSPAPAKRSAANAAPAAETAEVAKTANRAADHTADPPPADAALSAATALAEVAPAAASDSESATSPFAVKSWLRPPPPPPPPKPVAPPLPFQYLGKLSEGEQTRIFLKHDDKHVVASTGDVIMGVYRVDEIGAGRMTFVYQPLNEKQQLAIGSDK